MHTPAKPFGTLDTPTQGGTISGSDYVNFGWALTQATLRDPGRWLDHHRGDRRGGGLDIQRTTSSAATIANLFTGYANSNGAVGFFHLNTTTLANGVHTIFLETCSTNGGRGDGNRKPLFQCVQFRWTSRSA